MKQISNTLRVGVIGEHNEKRDQINQEWITFLQELEYIPILIPNNLNNLQKYIQDEAKVKRIQEIIDLASKKNISLAQMIMSGSYGGGSSSKVPEVIPANQ